jgi:ADP-heptose:LPS heptosyltransferase
MVEWLRLSELVITNDTGPMHVAAALRRPVVALFGPTEPGSTGPYGQRQNVIQVSSLPCMPCMKDYCAYKEPLACLQGITPKLVCEKALGQLSAPANALA